MKRFFIIAAAAMLCIALSGCNVLETDTEALMKPPVFTEEQEKLNAALAEVIGESYTLKYPKAEDINSAFIFKDLDGDGIEEVMAFYTLFDESTRINVLKNNNGNWISVYEAAGFYGDIESVDFANISDESCVIVIKWNQEVGIYRYKNERLQTLHSDSCEWIEISDINGDGFGEVIIIDRNPMNKSTLKIVYAGDDGVNVTDDISIHADYEKIYAKGNGKLCEGKNIYFIDSEIYEGVYLTEIFTLENGEAKRLFIADFVNYDDDENKNDEQNVIVSVGGGYGERGIFLRNTKVCCMDINRDGIIEMPVEYRDDYAQQSSDEIFYLMYMQYDGSNSNAVWNGVANTECGYLFEVPEIWNENIIAKFGSSTDELIFTDKTTGRVIYEIFAVSKNDYQDKYEEYVLASEDKSKNYYIKSHVDEKNKYYISPEKYAESFIFI